MNEKNIVSIDTVIDRIKIRGYIDCNEYDGYMENYEYDNILYYLEKYKNLQSKIDKAIEWIEQYEKQIGTLGETSKSIVLTDDVVIGNLLDILKEDK